MKPIAKPVTDIVYRNIEMLRKMPGHGVLQHGWNIQASGTYLVTVSDGGIRCQYWNNRAFIKETNETIKEGLQLVN